MKRQKFLITLAMLVCTLSCLLPVMTADDRATDKKPAAENASLFLRFVEDEDGGGVLESAIVSYKNAAGVKVHLVAALHVGEKSYYEGLDKTFATYDALLYELIKEKGMSIQELYKQKQQAGGGPLSPVSMLQHWLKNTLELEFQLDSIDYTRKNFIHADLDIETFLKLQEKKGENLLTLMLRAIKHDMQRQMEGKEVSQITVADLIRIFLSKDRSREMKLVLGRQFNSIEDSLAGIEGPNGSVILTERNKVAVKVLKETIAKGKKNIGIFYGAGHMQDIEARICRELGFVKTGQEWRIAWNMREGASKSVPKPAPKKVLRRKRF